jgi:hypothetical protein
MLTLAIWWVGTLLEALLLWRGVQAKLVRVFPIFYSYLLVVLVSEVVRFVAYHSHPSSYAFVYWFTQFLSLVVGSAVIFEIYRVGLGRFPGTARMTQYFLLIVFGIVFVKTVAKNFASADLYPWITGSLVDLERNFRIVQAVALVALLSLFFLYAIPFGRNLRGILVGYGLFIGATITQFTLLFYWRHDDVAAFWSYLQPICYDLVLCFWTASLWSLDIVPEVEPQMQLERDYQMLADSTRRQFERTLSRLTWTARS